MVSKVSKRSAVFGLTFHGRQFVRRFAKEGLDLALILDNDPRKSGDIFCNVPIAMPEPEICEGIEQYFVLGRFAIEHIKQLIDLGVSENQINHVSRSDIALTGEALATRDLLTMKYMRAISEACDTCGCDMYLDSSGLLAAARNEALGGLSDVDLLVGNGSILELEIFLKKMQKDWIIQTNIDRLAPDDKSQIVIMSGKLTDPLEEPAVIDIRTPKLNPTISKNPKYISLHFKHSSKLLEGTSIKFPHCYEDYLEILYGPNWRIPDQFYRP